MDWLNTLRRSGGINALSRQLGVSPAEVARRAVLIEAERNSGLDQALGERMLPGLAMLVGGYITARAGGSGAEGSGGLSGLGSLLDTLSPTANDTGSDRI